MGSISVGQKVNECDFKTSLGVEKRERVGFRKDEMEISYDLK